MAKTLNMSADLKLALLRSEPVFIVLFGHDDTDASNRPLYAINLRDCAEPPVKGRVDFSIPSLYMANNVTITGAHYAKEGIAPDTFEDLGKVEGVQWPVTVVNGNFHMQGLYVELT